jgi:DNA-binding MarR family transcriptional regulator
MAAPSAGSPAEVPAEQIEALMAGSRALGALIAESLASVETVVTMPQLRVLILVDREPQSMGAIAADLGVHASNATRTCERLVQAGLLHRQTAEEDRRRVVLSLTTKGHDLLEGVMSHRRERIVQVLEQMGADDRAALASSIKAFAEIAGTEGPGPHPVPARHAGSRAVRSTAGR